MEDRRDQQRVAAGRCGLRQVRDGVGAARCDQRQVRRCAGAAQQLEVVAFAGAVAVDAGQQDLAGAAVRGSVDPLDRLQSGLAPAAVGFHEVVSVGITLRVDGEHDGLVAERVRESLEQGRIAGRGRVDGDLVGAALQQLGEEACVKDMKARIVREHREMKAKDAAHRTMEEAFFKEQARERDRIVAAKDAAHEVKVAEERVEVEAVKRALDLEKVAHKKFVESVASDRAEVSDEQKEALRRLRTRKRR